MGGSGMAAPLQSQQPGTSQFSVGNPGGVGMGMGMGVGGNMGSNMGGMPFGAAPAQQAPQSQQFDDAGGFSMGRAGDLNRQSSGGGNVAGRRKVVAQRKKV